ncbi:hypothetical protein, conserved [Eimeria maxima]|uniref:Ppg3 n=1 Tax=Eimeria maxima TaxID=5804 RepID=U6MCC7_EIMMA|nr:hypothetical protein, conserved [Eimeria maxima]CDJ61671.1 hypothetical protein, conserved [Eimeria maxima]
MQHLSTETTSRETASNAAHSTSTAASHALAVPAALVVAEGSNCESQNAGEGTSHRQQFGLIDGKQQDQQEQKLTYQREQRCRDQPPPRTSGPLVLEGRVRYSFATRTVDSCQLQSLCSVQVQSDNINRTATSRSIYNGCSGGSGASTSSKGICSTAASCSLRGSSVFDSGREGASWGLNCEDTGSSDSSSSCNSNGGGTVYGNGSSIKGSICSPDDGHHAIPASLQASSATGPPSVVVNPREDAYRRVSCRSTDFSTSTSSGKSSNICCDAEENRLIPLLSATDIALLLRDYAAFIHQTERQLQQLQKLVQQQQVAKFGDDRPRQQQECLGLGWPNSSGRPLTGTTAFVRQQRQCQRHQQQQQPEEAKRLRRCIAEGAVVCHSLHSRLCLLLVESSSTAVTAAGSELLLGKLRRDFVQQQQQYTRLLRLLSSAADALSEQHESVHQRETEAIASIVSNAGSTPPGETSGGSFDATGPARIIWHSGHQGSPCTLPVDCLHFEDPQIQRQRENSLWNCWGDHAYNSSGEAANSCLHQPDRSLWLQGFSGALPPLFIGPSDPRTSVVDGASHEDLWEPAALIEVHEDYEKQQIISERKQQLQQLQQVEHCVAVLRELQLHVTEDVDRGNQRLHTVEEETEAAADHTEAGVGELAAAARNKTRWWGVQGGGAAALLGVGVGAVAGGPIGAAVGAIVGAVAGLSSGAALRGRHRERVNAAERSVRRRRAQRVKRSLISSTPGGLSTIQGSASGAISLGCFNQTREAGARTGSGTSLLWDPVGVPHYSSGARPCSAPGITSGRSNTCGPQAAGAGPTGSSDRPTFGEAVHEEGIGTEAKGALQSGQPKLVAGRNRQRHQRASIRLAGVQGTLGATGILPVMHFSPG